MASNNLSLQEVLSEWREAKQKRAAHAAMAEKFTKEFAEHRSTVIQPEMDRMADVLRANGHRADVTVSDEVT